MTRIMLAALAAAFIVTPTTISAKAETATELSAKKHHRQPTDGNGNATTRGHVCSKSGVCVSVSYRAQGPLQCVVNHVEAAGVSIKYMRGYGRGTVRGSMHPHGDAIDINQTARNRTKPHVPASVSNAAADACGVVSGARWGYADNGHWNLRGREQGPVIAATPAAY